MVCLFAKLQDWRDKKASTVLDLPQVVVNLYVLIGH